ncbi:MAG: zinc-ribbon domain-containing protein [Clostridiales bacterium]|nr:zinc-ribbon domain-containing protein [Clostridiales bacterium]
MNFCINCGKELEKGAVFCENCGTKAEDEIITSSPKGKKKMLFIILTAAVVLMVFTLFGGRNCNSVIKSYINARISGDVAKTVSLYPSKLLERSAEAWYLDSKEDFTEEFIQDNVEELSAKILSEANGKKSNVSYEITEIKNFEDRDLALLQSDWKDYGLKIKAGKEVTVQINLKNSTSYWTINMEVVKIGNSWYVWKEFY